MRKGTQKGIQKRKGQLEDKRIRVREGRWWGCGLFVAVNSSANRLDAYVCTIMATSSRSEPTLNEGSLYASVSTMSGKARCGDFSKVHLLFFFTTWEREVKFSRHDSHHM